MSGLSTLLVLAQASLPGVGADYVIEDYAIAEPLTAAAGDPGRGLKVMLDRQLGNCLGCHHLPIDAEFFGTTGRRRGERLTAPQLRLRLVDPKQVNPLSMMPAYYKSAGLHRVLEDFAGKSILSAQQIEDVVAYLATLSARD